MRLIDADKLIEAMNLWGMHKYENPEAYDTLMKYEILQEIEDQPTAYDVEKVVEKIGRKSMDNTDGRLAVHPKLMGSYISITSDAIDIVKRGGIERG